MLQKTLNWSRPLAFVAVEKTHRARKRPERARRKMSFEVLVLLNGVAPVVLAFHFEGRGGLLEH